ncbi:MAG TPA: hypothetical protein VIY51_10890, partial [Xanthobacteraceae bacterium]
LFQDQRRYRNSSQAGATRSSGGSPRIAKRIASNCNSGWRKLWAENPPDGPLVHRQTGHHE